MKTTLALRLFLGAYLALLLMHISSELYEVSATGIVALVIGIGIALYAHTRSGILLYVLLCIHMAIEWIGYGIAGWHFDTPDGAFSLIHLGFDVVFLFILGRMAWGARYVRRVFATLGGLGVISAIAYGVAHDAASGVAQTVDEHAHAFSLGPIEFLVLGGILGCTLYHFVKLPGMIATHRAQKNVHEK